MAGLVVNKKGSLGEQLNLTLHRWSYRRLWDWAVMEDVAGAMSVAFYFPADNASRQTAHIRPKELEYRYSFGEPMIPGATQELVHDALPGRRSVLISHAAAEAMVKHPGLAQDWLERELRAIEEHEFREFFRRRDGTCVIDPHPEYAK